MRNTRPTTGAKGRRRRRFGTKCVPFILLGVILVLGAALLFGETAQRAYLKAAYPVRYEQEILRWSRERGLSPSLVFAVVYNESRFRPDAVSGIGARGLMQITEETFEWAKMRMGDTDTEYDDLFDPEVNIRYGTYILSVLLEEFESPGTALAAYHAGWGSVKGWLSDERYSPDGKELSKIPFDDTAWYVPRVLETAEIYENLDEWEET